MASTTDQISYEDLNLNPLKTNDTLLNNLDNAEILDTENFNLDTTYLLPEEAHNFFQNSKPDEFSVLHLNVRSLRKDFEEFKTLLYQMKFTFEIMSL